MRKYIFVLAFVIAILILTGCNIKKQESDKLLIPGDMGVAKFEYAAEDNNGYKLITGEIAVLTNFFNSVVLHKSEEEFYGDWIYRITFSNSIEGRKERLTFPEDADTIIILVGESCLQINGETFITAEGTDYLLFLDIISFKYKYFDYELYYD